ncbi:hypothetical protein SISNIDRAFT_85685 [Sistotremastrum niveocremeum HHB9708]|uniref:Zinc-hook domain-containing protein n=1 Tax=Sistotremastrum niveocremeum HHB9708 TaxID=1314777 RepID=A0A164UUH2_9AGAM|nr:hypothetical protein SISNIDRAFT_85685 [Sistotremastrum niveocremeum HHB9708]
MQAEGQVRIREMESSLRRLQNEAITLRHERDSSQDKIADIKAAIETDEAKIEESQTLNTKLEHLKADIHDKSSRIESIKMATREANYDARLQEKLNHSREWEDVREQLTDELRNLNMQADSRAKLDLKRTEVKAKRRDFESVLSNSTPKFKHFTGHNPQVGSMEAEIDTLIRSKEVDLTEAEEQVNNARREHEKIEAMLANLTKQLDEKIAEATSLDTKLKNEVDQSFESVGAAIKDATSEVNFRRDASNKALGSSKIWESLLKKGKSKHVCTACNRHLSDSEMPIFEQFLQDQIKKSSDEKVAEYQAELPTWEVELARLQQLLPIEARLKSMTGIEIPSLREQIKVQQSLEPDASELVKEIVTVPQNLKRELKELSTLKQQSVNLAHGQSDITQLEADISRIEQNLAHTGSTRTANDVQEELDQLTLKMSVLFSYLCIMAHSYVTVGRANGKGIKLVKKRIGNETSSTRMRRSSMILKCRNKVS